MPTCVPTAVAPRAPGATDPCMGAGCARARVLSGQSAPRGSVEGDGRSPRQLTPGDTEGVEPRIRRVVFGIMLSVFLGAMESTAVATAMPKVVASLGGIAMYSWVTSGFLVTF